jgi:hypothetical protein
MAAPVPQGPHASTTHLYRRTPPGIFYLHRFLHLVLYHALATPHDARYSAS